MLPYAKRQRGTFTNVAGNPYDIQISSMNPPQYIELRNITEWGTPSVGSTQQIEWWWEQSMAQFTARGITQTSSSTPAMNANQLTSDGISTYSTWSPPTFTINTTGTAVTKGSLGGVTVATITNDGNAARGPKVAVGDFVRLTNVVGMQQISGMTFQVVAVTSTTSVTLDLDSSAFAASGTTFNMQKIIPNRFTPKVAFITAITLANPCVVSLIRDSSFTIGEEVSFRMPANNVAAGFTTMQQIANMKGVVSAVTNATATTCSTVTVNINTSGFTAFALPTSAEAAAGTAGQQPISMIVPAGSGVVPNQQPPGTDLLSPFDNQNIWVVHLGASIFTNSTNGDVWEYVVEQADEYNNQ